MPEDETMKPCLFIKLNKIFNFDPKPVDASNLDDPMFDSMTTQLKVDNAILKIELSGINFAWFSKIIRKFDEYIVLKIP